MFDKIVECWRYAILGDIFMLEIKIMILFGGI